MPGIFGLIHKEGASGRFDRSLYYEALKIMAATMSYEPHYTSIMCEFEKLGVYVGYIGPTDEGAIIDRQKGLSLFISGIAYHNQMENRKRFDCNDKYKQGYEIIQCYLQVAERFPEKINSQFAGFLIDEINQDGFLFNDHFGVERIYLYEDDERLVFASEAKAILKVIPETRHFDPIGLAEFLTCGTTLGENSLFQKIRVLPCGSMIKFSKGRSFQIRRYLDPSSMEESNPLEADIFIEKLSETLRTTISQYLRFSSWPAVSLTGGLDSRIIVACIDALNTKIPCYTFGSMYRDTYDVLTSKSLSKYCNLPNYILTLDKHFLSKFDYFLNRAVFISDGYLGFSGASELYLNMMARRISPIRITGNYGGELLRGVRAFKSLIPKGGFLRPSLFEGAVRSSMSFYQYCEMNPCSFTLFVQVPSGYGRYAIERSQVSTFTPFLNLKIVELIYRMPSILRSDKDSSVSVIKSCCEKLLDIPTDRGQLGRDNNLTRAIRRVFRESMFKLEYWTGHGTPDKIAALSRLGIWISFTRLFTGRHKFQHFHIWMRKEILRTVQSLLEDGHSENLDQYIDFKRVREMFSDHQNCKGNYINEIDRIVTIILADRLLLGNT